MKKEVIVTGGRDYDDEIMLCDTLDFLQPTLVVQGGANGADNMARQWAEDNNVECVTIEADWANHGKSAGPKRNLRMLKAYPNAVVLAFPGGKGTQNCIDTAVSLNRLVLMIHK